MTFILWGVTPLEATVAEDTTGGGSSREKTKRRSRYPRRVVIDGAVYWVNNADEERRLLQAMAERAREQAQIAEALGDTELAETVRRKSVRIQRRVRKADDREAEWLARLRDEDDELLILFG